MFEMIRKLLGSIAGIRSVKQGDEILLSPSQGHLFDFKSGKRLASF